ncbi:hypothetical protein V7O62_02830 [Methanolobus sp. ZRKC2]|uniref:hypothetical protein n=1 Tax=Methanolobus sp. ZRKC2 TaxID=3125783 RepID=UPI003254517F
MTEEIVYGSINNACGKKGLVGTLKDYDLIFTDKRIIFAMVANTGTAFMLAGNAGWAISKLGKNKKREKYQNLDLESILKNNSKNFDLTFSNIRKVQLQETWPWSFLVLETTKGTMKFEVRKNEIESAKRLIDICLSDKIKNN